MIETSFDVLGFEAFVSQYGDDPRYELIDGGLIDLEPTGAHEEVAAFLLRKINAYLDRQDLDWFTPARCLIKPLGQGLAYRPDVIVIDRQALTQEPLWKQEPIITLGSSVKLVIEVVSSNWPNDYARKVEDYSAMGIPEYWIIDHEGLGGRQLLGYPKQQTLSLCTLTEQGIYEIKRLRGEDPVESTTFPDLALTAAQIWGPTKDYRR